MKDETKTFIVDCITGRCSGKARIERCIQLREEYPHAEEVWHESEWEDGRQVYYFYATL